MDDSLIARVRGREILDSRGVPTVEAEVWLRSGARGCAAVPSGASVGTHEAVERRDGDDRYRGRGVRKAVASLNGEIADLLIGQSADDQFGIDRQLVALDGTTNKGRLGANAILAASLAVARASAAARGVELFQYLGGVQGRTLPTPMVNVINGGAHANNSMDIQEFMIVPHNFPTFTEAMRAASETFAALGRELSRRGLPTTVGDEGGYAPDLSGSAAALDVIMEAIGSAGYVPGEDIALALDVAAGELCDDGVYGLPNEGQTFDGEGMVEYLSGLVDQYPIVSIEDGMDENDRTGWRLLGDALRNRIQLVGDDVFVTNRQRLQTGIDDGIANAVLVKVNQVGTLSETLETMDLARAHGYASVVSHRSGETEDTTIADLAVATNCGQIKTGSMSRSERLAKYNRLVRIEEALGAAAIFAGADPFVRFAEVP